MVQKETASLGTTEHRPVIQGLAACTMQNMEPVPGWHSELFSAALGEKHRVGSVWNYSFCIIHEGNPQRGEGGGLNKKRVEQRGGVCPPICCGLVGLR